MTAKPMTYFLYLDDYHLDDPLFVSSMARMMHRRQALPRCVMVHGSGGEVERRFEAEGLFPETQHGLIQPATPEDAALVEQALRATTRKIVGALVDEIIYAVGFQGTDRGLLQLRDDAVTLGKTGWLLPLVQQGALPVISAVAQTPEGRPRQVAAHAALLALAAAFEGATVVFFTRDNRPGLFIDGSLQPEAGAAEVPEALLPNPTAFRATVAAGYPVLLTSAVGLWGSDDLQATYIPGQRA